MSPSQTASQKSEASNGEAPIQDSSQKPEDQSQSQVQTQGETPAESSQAEQSQDHLDQTVLSQGSSKSTQENKGSDDESVVSSQKSTVPAQTASQPAASQSQSSAAAASQDQVGSQPETLQRRASQWAEPHLTAVSLVPLQNSPFQGYSFFKCNNSNFRNVTLPQINLLQ